MDETRLEMRDGRGKRRADTVKQRCSIDAAAAAAKVIWAIEKHARLDLAIITITNSPSSPSFSSGTGKQAGRHSGSVLLSALFQCDSALSNIIILIVFEFFFLIYRDEGYTAYCLLPAAAFYL